MSIPWEWFLNDLNYPAERASAWKREVREKIVGQRIWDKVPPDVYDALKELREAVKKFDKIVQDRIQ